MNKWKINQKSEELVELYLYGEVNEGNYDFFGDFVNGKNSAESIRDELEKYPNAKEINVYINSVGGDVMQGTAIYNLLKRSKAFKTIYVDGFACSIASVIAMAGDKVVMPKNTMMMIHNCWTCAVGNANELRKVADDLDKIMEANIQAYLMKTNGKISEEKLKEFLNEEKYLTASECLEYGFADELVEQEVDETNMKMMLKNSNLTLSQQLDFQKSLKQLLRETAPIEHKEEKQDKEEVQEQGGLLKTRRKR